ncbi:MAG: T9SS type A sorting domain-containing protein [Bacteroidota bacterium]
MKSPIFLLIIGLCWPVLSRAQCELAINLINAELVCQEETTDPDLVNLNIPFMGTDPFFMTTVTVVSPPSAPEPEVGGQDPATDEEGFIIISNMIEGGTYLISLMGLNCNFGSLNYFIPDGTCGMILPVELEFFSAQTRAPSQMVALNWATAAEENADYFALERSTDGGRNFYPVTQIPSAGYSTERKAYAWSDRSPAVGTNYYRLLQYDFDGSFTTYGPVFADFEARNQSELTFYPSPTAGLLYLTAQDKPVRELEIWSLQGQLVRSLSLANTTRQAISIYDLRPGVYQFLIYDDRRNLLSSQLITKH